MLSNTPDGIPNGTTSGSIRIVESIPGRGKSGAKDVVVGMHGDGRGCGERCRLLLLSLACLSSCPHAPLVACIRWFVAIIIIIIITIIISAPHGYTHNVVILVDSRFHGSVPRWPEDTIRRHGIRRR